jgi:hypothetical protein
MNRNNILFAARKPRADAIQFLLSVGLDRCRLDGTELVGLDSLVHDYMLFGPEHSARSPFPSEEDLTSSLVWLQRNGYLFLAGDDVISLTKEYGGSSPFSTRLLCNAVEGALDRLESPAVPRIPAMSPMKFA